MTRAGLTRAFLLTSLLASGCLVLLATALAQAQEVDVAVGAGTLYSTKSQTASEAFLPPGEKGGIYPSVSAQDIFHGHFGIGGEFAWRDKKGLYDGYQRFRPFLYDINGVYARTVTKKIEGDVMGGVGGQTVVFYNQFSTCTLSAGGCLTYVNSTHFLVHVGADLRYNVWRKFFVRPEAHYYFVRNNFEFHTDNVFRVGVSIGRTF